MLASSRWDFRTLPDSNVVAFAMTLEGCDETAHTSAYDEDVDSRGWITVYIAVPVRWEGIGVGESQCFFEASHGWYIL
jgi:hypothetical protein